MSPRARSGRDTTSTPARWMSKAAGETCREAPFRVRFFVEYEGITGGCGGGNYCPENPVTRAQMAVFLVRTFYLPLSKFNAKTPGRKGPSNLCVFAPLAPVPIRRERSGHALGVALKIRLLVRSVVEGGGRQIPMSQRGGGMIK